MSCNQVNNLKIDTFFKTELFSERNVVRTSGRIFVGLEIVQTEAKLAQKCVAQIFQLACIQQCEQQQMKNSINFNQDII